MIVQGDADWLERLVLNLVDNAIKFTPAGGRAVVAVSREAADARLAAQDTGIAIDPALAPHIFERFFRADPARSSGVEGAGLGLSLAKRVVDRHRGRIEVESQPGHGSTFTVSLPLARQQALVPPSSVPSSLTELNPSLMESSGGSRPIAIETQAQWGARGGCVCSQF